MNNVDLKKLIKQQKPNFTLDQEFYIDDYIFDLDIKNIFSKQWVFVGHVSRIPKYGDYFLFNIGNESIIIIRDKDDLIHAHYNVCRHRGSHICLEEEGNKKLLGFSDKFININPSKIFKLHLFKLQSFFIKLSSIILADFIEPSKL